jgi:hypothetical protein
LATAATHFAPDAVGSGSTKMCALSDPLLAKSGPHVNLVQKRAPTCPICRAKLTRKMPLMPNITLDAVLARHVAALGAARADGWAAPDLSRHVEWTARCTKARTAAAERAVAAAAKARAAPPARARPRVVVFEPNGGPWLVPDDDDEDETYEASDGEPSAGAVFVHQVGRRASRRR